MYLKYRHFLKLFYLSQMIPILYCQNYKQLILRLCTLGLKYEFPVFFFLFGFTE